MYKRQGQITASGSYRLDADITVPDGVMLTVPAELNITLDLNGHKVEKPQGNGRILDNYGTMVINDSKGGGVVDAYRNAEMCIRDRVSVAPGERKVRANAVRHEGRTHSEPRVACLCRC